MFTYQAYLAKDNGEISCSPEVFLASDDAAAIEQVQRKVDVQSYGRAAAA